MTWESFQCLASNLRYKEEVLFRDEQDASLISLKQVQAKSDMLMDLLQSLGYDSSSDLSDILDDHTDFLREALAYKQLEWYFFELDQGEGSVNRERWKRYKTGYEGFKSKFPTLVNSQVAARTVRIYR